MKTKSFTLFILTFATVVLAAVTAFAADYTISGASWDFDDMSAVATWEKCDSSTGYKLELYRNGKKVGKTVSSSGSKHNFTSTIVKSGTGRYVFNIWSTKGGVDYTVASDVLEVDSEMMRGFKKAQPQSKSSDLPYPVPSSKGVDHWHQNPDLSWTFYKADGKKLTGFQNIGGYTYYFNSNGNTLYNWQYLSGRWYYFEPKGSNAYPQGAMYVNCTTPDGYLVNEKGEWCVDGVPVTQKDFSKNKNQASYNGSAKTRDITNCTITLNVDKNISGVPGYAEPSGATNCDITSFSYDKPYEQWTTGSSVKITVNLVPKKGYRFTNSTKFSCSSASVYTKSGTGADARTVVLSYSPQSKLDMPTGFMVSTNDGLLTWDKVPGAKRYRIVIRENRTTAVNEIITENEYPVDDYLYDDDDEMSVNIKVTALPSENNKHVKESATAEIADLSELVAVSGTNGSFEKDGKKYYFTDDNGELATGWTQIGGYWYYFSPKNNAAVSGWFQDPSSGLWYYFEPSSHKMLIGQQYIDSKMYFLNDGSVAGLPLGAWHEGHQF